MKDNVVCFYRFINKLFIFKIFFNYSYFLSSPVFSTYVSSAYIIDLPCVRSRISLTYRIKSNGPRTDPRGNLYLTGRLLDKCSFI
jgi:hypothetical protein